jgi:hypothetical protein
MAGPTVCEARWSETLTSFDKHRDELVTAYQGAEEDIGLIRAALVKIGLLICNYSSKNGKDAAWKELTTQAETEKYFCVSTLRAKP